MKLFIVFFGILALVGCNLYSSSGRKQFETQSEGRINTVVGSSANLKEDLCWSQPANEPLWNFEEQATPLKVRKLDKDTLEVCTTGAQQ